MNAAPLLQSGHEDPDTRAQMATDPSRDIYAGLIIAALFFVGFLGWATFARLDAAAYAPGVLVVLGQRQAVQHRDGGVVSRIFVREGERVVRGQPLIRLAAAEVQAQERSLASQSIRLLAQKARLEAEQLGRTTITVPAEFTALAGKDKRDAVLAMQLQRTELSARAAVLVAKRSALSQRVAQSGAQFQGYGKQAKSASEQLRLIDAQISALRPVADRGFVSQTRIRELERIRADLEGRRGQYSASMAQARGAVREGEFQALEAGYTFRERSASDLQDVEARLGELMPKWIAARDQLERTIIRAPATGAIVDLSVFTPGGVVAAGQTLMEIVPEKKPFQIQARFDPEDADDVSVGQLTLIKFTGLHERALPNLEGRVAALSADSFTDQRTGKSYFTGTISVSRNQLRTIQEVRGKGFALRSGMPVQVLIPLRKRTALNYALEPLIGSFWASFREH